MATGSFSAAVDGPTVMHIRAALIGLSELLKTERRRKEAVRGMDVWRDSEETGGRMRRIWQYLKQYLVCEICPSI